MKCRAFRKFWEENWLYNREDAEKWSRRSANHMASCSGACCGNPRRHFNERTIAEKKADLSFKDQVEEVEDHRLVFTQTPNRLRSV